MGCSNSVPSSPVERKEKPSSSSRRKTKKGKSRKQRKAKRVLAESNQNLGSQTISVSGSFVSDDDDGLVSTRSGVTSASNSNYTSGGYTATSSGGFGVEQDALNSLNAAAGRPSTAGGDRQPPPPPSGMASTPHYQSFPNSIASEATLEHSANGLPIASRLGSAENSFSSILSGAGSLPISLPDYGPVVDPFDASRRLPQAQGEEKAAESISGSGGNNSNSSNLTNPLSNLEDISSAKTSVRSGSNKTSSSGGTTGGANTTGSGGFSAAGKNGRKASGSWAEGNPLAKSMSGGEPQNKSSAPSSHGEGSGGKNASSSSLVDSGAFSLTSAGGSDGRPTDSPTQQKLIIEDESIQSRPQVTIGLSQLSFLVPRNKDDAKKTMLMCKGYYDPDLRVEFLTPQQRYSALVSEMANTSDNAPLSGGGLLWCHPTLRGGLPHPLVVYSSANGIQPKQFLDFSYLAEEQISRIELSLDQHEYHKAVTCAETIVSATFTGGLSERLLVSVTQLEVQLRDFVVALVNPLHFCSMLRSQDYDGIFARCKKITSMFHGSATSSQKSSFQTDSTRDRSFASGHWSEASVSMTTTTATTSTAHSGGLHTLRTYQPFQQSGANSLLTASTSYASTRSGSVSGAMMSMSSTTTSSSSTYSHNEARMIELAQFVQDELRLRLEYVIRILRRQLRSISRQVKEAAAKNQLQNSSGRVQQRKSNAYVPPPAPASIAVTTASDGNRPLQQRQQGGGPHHQVLPNPLSNRPAS